MTSAVSGSTLQAVAVAGALLVALATLRWGRRGAVLGYGVGLLVCVLAWSAAVFLTTRLDGGRPGDLGAALGRSVAAIAVLSSLWLAVASAGAVAGALGRLLYRRLRLRRREAPRARPGPDRTARRRRSRAP